MEVAEKFIRSLADPFCAIDFQRTVERILSRWHLKPEIVIKLHDGVLIEQLAEGRYHQPPAMCRSPLDRIRR